VAIGAAEAVAAGSTTTEPMANWPTRTTLKATSSTATTFAARVTGTTQRPPRQASSSVASPTPA